MLGRLVLLISRYKDIDRRDIDKMTSQPSAARKPGRPLAASRQDSAPPEHTELNPVHGIHTLRPVAVFATDPMPNAHIGLHSHRRDQLIHAIEGVMIVKAKAGRWVVPPGRAVWVPGGTPHAIQTAGQVRMRTVFVEPGFRPALGTVCRVLPATPLLQQLILRGLELGLDYPLGGREERVMALLLDEIEVAPSLSLHVPMPAQAALARLCSQFLAAPAQDATLVDWARRLHMNERTLARRFQSETGMGHGAWVRQARLLLSLSRLAEGASVLTVALEHGYDSPSAYAAMFRRSMGMPPSQYLPHAPQTDAAA
jgi:AraC-like DNA-binding protein/mannose-6-phosphate isomerase-like protein (cupin superfamily)